MEDVVGGRCMVRRRKEGWVDGGRVERIERIGRDRFNWEDDCNLVELAIVAMVGLLSMINGGTDSRRSVVMLYSFDSRKDRRRLTEPMFTKTAKTSESVPTMRRRSNR